TVQCFSVALSSQCGEQCMYLLLIPTSVLYTSMFKTPPPRRHLQTKSLSLYRVLFLNKSSSTVLLLLAYSSFCPSYPWRKPSHTGQNKESLRIPPAAANTLVNIHIDFILPAQTRL